MAIKAIIFDCFGVLVSSGRVNMYRDYPMLHAEIDDLERQMDYGMASRQQFNDSVSELTGLSVDEIERRYWSIYARNELVIDWANQLKTSGEYKVGVLSNVGRGFISDFLPEIDRGDLFDSVILSSSVGMIKPDPAIFELAAKQLNVLTYECVMIDDLPPNIDAAQFAGMKGIVFGSLNQAKSDLRELLELSYA
jgi:putative hydrolase of the HAD superfamily